MTGRPHMIIEQRRTPASTDAGVLSVYIATISVYLDLGSTFTFSLE